MIKIRVSQLDVNGIDIAGTEKPSFLELEASELLKCNGDISYSLHVSFVNGGVLVQGMIKAVFDAVCGRCLETFSLEILNSGVCHYYENVTEHELDISGELREDILINIPQNYLCSEDCRGLCHLCGSNLNVKKCRCDEDNTPASDVWKNLDDLDIER